MPKKQPTIDLSGIFSAVQPGPVSVEEARRIAHAILDACEDADPTEEESEWERYAAQQAREMAAEKVRDLPNDARTAWRQAAKDMGLDVHEPSPHHVQFRRGKKVFAEWWPGRGTTMHAQQRGPRCADAQSIVRWLRSLL